MPEPQPQLPFDEHNALDEIRRLLETQNDLLRDLVQRLSDQGSPAFDQQEPILECGLGPEFGDPSFDEYQDDDDMWDDIFDDDEEVLPDPPMWFARHYPFE